jgi:hypothetical protein
MGNRRRVFIIITSVLLGTFFAFLLVRSRMGTLKPNDWFQLAFNFLFAVAIVVGLGMLFKKMKHKDPKE